MKTEEHVLIGGSSAGKRIEIPPDEIRIKMQSAPLYHGHVGDIELYNRRKFRCESEIISVFAASRMRDDEVMKELLRGYLVNE